MLKGFMIIRADRQLEVLKVNRQQVLMNYISEFSIQKEVAMEITKTFCY